MRTLLIVVPLALLSFLPFSVLANAPSTPKGVNLHVRMFLQGALLGVKQPAGLMRDDLRVAGLIPSQEPYSALSNYSHYGEKGGSEVIASEEVLKVTGPDAIVDWVFIELRHPEVQKIVLATRSALLQRDGDVVDVDGVSAVHFEAIEPGSYLVVVRHRNHLGVMAATAFDLAKKPVLVDFSQPKGKFLGNHPMIQIADKMALFAGDVNRDGEVNLEGAESDKDHLFFHVMLNGENVDGNKNFILKGYSNYDVNMDGEVKYQGPNSDGSYLSFDIVFFWRYNCPQVDKDCRLVEQLP